MSLGVWGYSSFVRLFKFVPFHISNIKLLNSFRTTECTYVLRMWYELFLTLRINKTLKWRQRWMLVLMCMRMWVSLLSFSFFLFIRFVLSYRSTKVPYNVWYIRIYVCFVFDANAKYMHILLPRWCLVSCQSIFYNVAFVHFEAKESALPSPLHPPSSFRNTGREREKISFSKWFFVMKPFSVHTECYVCVCIFLSSPVCQPRLLAYTFC